MSDQALETFSNHNSSQLSDVDLSDDDNEQVDPRVQDELETLNSASSDINTLEIELEKSRNKFRTILTESTHQLNTVFKKLGKCVLKARPYYDLLKESQKAQTEAQKAAVNFHRANSVYVAAKEMVQLAEERNNIPENEEDKKQFDAAWQEMLNHATIKFMESERVKTQSEAEHLQKAAQYADIQQKLRHYEKDIGKTIQKAKPYFDLKDRLEKQLQVERVNVEDLQMALMCAKQKYRSALSNLEAISDEIHAKRKSRLELPPRTPGVGAESDVCSLPSVNLDNISDFDSQASVDWRDADGVSVSDISPSDSDLYQTHPRYAQVVEGSDTIPDSGKLLEPAYSNQQEQELHKASLVSNPKIIPEGQTFDRSQPEAIDAQQQTLVRRHKNKHQHGLGLQKELPILQHLRDNQLETNASLSSLYGKPPYGASSSRHCDDEVNDVTEEVFV